MGQLVGNSSAEAASSPAPPRPADLTIDELASQFRKRPSTVRAWVERGDFPGAYKLHGKGWRIPSSAIEAFKDRQRRGTRGTSTLSAWRSVANTMVRARPRQGQQEVTERPSSGNAED